MTAGPILQMRRLRLCEAEYVASKCPSRIPTRVQQYVGKAAIREKKRRKDGRMAGREEVRGKKKRKREKSPVICQFLWCKYFPQRLVLSY